MKRDFTKEADKRKTRLNIPTKSTTNSPSAKPYLVYFKNGVFNIRIEVNSGEVWHSFGYESRKTADEALAKMVNLFAFSTTR